MATLIMARTAETPARFAECFEITIEGITYQILRARTRWTARGLGVRKRGDGIGVFISGTTKDNALRMLELHISLNHGQKLHLTTTPKGWTPARPETGLWQRIDSRFADLELDSGDLGQTFTQL